MEVEELEQRHDYFALYKKVKELTGQGRQSFANKLVERYGKVQYYRNSATSVDVILTFAFIELRILATQNSVD